jgi:hypothetical protein
VGVRYAGSLASAACGGDGACKAARRAYGGQAASAAISAVVGQGGGACVSGGWRSFRRCSGKEEAPG